MKSATIVQFPRHGLTASSPIDPSEIALITRQSSQQTKRIGGWKMMLHWPIGLVWMLAGLLWPLLQWVGAMDVLFQCLRALYFSNTPALHATLQAGIHSGCYILISLCLSLSTQGVLKFKSTQNLAAKQLTCYKCLAKLFLNGGSSFFLLAWR